MDGTPTPVRTAERVARLHKALVGAGAACTADELLSAFNRVTQHLDARSREALEEVGPPGRWMLLARELGIPAELIPFEVVDKAYEDITLNPVASAMPYVHVALRAVRAAGYKLGVICNTGMAGGRVLREVLARHRLLNCFDVTVFSNEFGVSKPHPSIFLHALCALGCEPRQALHVGDIEDLDVRGARNAGMHAALYAPETRGDVETAADFVVTDWRSFPQQLADFVTPDR